MKFEERQFSKRFPKVTAALFVIHEPQPAITVQQGGKAIRIPQTTHRGTAAAIILPDGRYWQGVALCSPLDPYVKATGRQKAIGRAFQELRAGQNGDGYVNEWGKLDFADSDTKPEGHHWIDDLKFSLTHAIALAKRKQAQAAR